MTLPFPTASPLEEVCVALDLETTGLDPARDDIIEIGAVKFRGAEVLDTYETFVNPRRTISAFVTQLTGITQRQVDAAPPFSEVADKILSFLGPYPVVGHNVGFDLAFLSRSGVVPSSAHYDTMDLATVFLPSAGGYSLTGLADVLDISHDRPHRALEDARICHQLYLALVQQAMDADPGLLAAVSSIAGRSQWSLRSLLQQIAGQASRRGAGAASGFGVVGLDLEGLKGRLAKPRPLPTHRGPVVELTPDSVEALFAPDGPFSTAFPTYEHRPQQVRMARAVTEALQDGHHLVVEAGTGVGKSMAYLLPAMLFAAATGQRVVVSTNTINLQEQLIKKDIPTILGAMESSPEQPLKDFRYAHLKGRSNYLCLARWMRQARSGGLAPEDARMVAKTLVWLQDTTTGDRAEMNIPGRDGYLWDRMSAAAAEKCEGVSGVCFLRAARARAEASNLVVVNHALLLSDMAAGGGVIPEYDYVIVDEAHHLEEEASKQFGFEVHNSEVEMLASSLERGLREARTTALAILTEASRRQQVEDAASATAVVIPRLRESWSSLASTISSFVARHKEAGDQGNQTRITRSSRKQPAWSEVEIRWEGFNGAMVDVTQRVDKLLFALEPEEAALVKEAAAELAALRQEAEEVRQRVEGFVVHPTDEQVYWVTLADQDSTPTLSAAPLNVGPILAEQIFSQKKSVVLTSATLAVDGAMQYVTGRLGLDDAHELVLGSPFDFRRAALLLLPSDMPEPVDPGYQEALQDAIVRVARASKGAVLGLFTSHASLQAAHRKVKPVLEAEEGLTVLAQGIDGPPGRLVELAAANGNAVLLGTSSMWEGVDLPGDLLRAVVVARLPFNVPTDPLFAARSEEFTDPFKQYAVPQAVLRFRQGFGRLIRTKNDRGVVVVLDSRMRSRSYGKTFLRSLPPCTQREVALRQLEVEVAAWLKRG